MKTIFLAFSVVKALTREEAALRAGRPLTFSMAAST
jgi:hypothetical protein